MGVLEKPQQRTPRQGAYLEPRADSDGQLVNTAVAVLVIVQARRSTRAPRERNLNSAASLVTDGPSRRVISAHEKQVPTEHSDGADLIPAGRTDVHAAVGEVAREGQHGPGHGQVNIELEVIQ